jgi:GTPase SAR1 family protein
VAAKLIALGADPRARDAAGNTLLMAAAGAGHTACVQLLLERRPGGPYQAGVDPADTNDAGDSALSLAALGGHVDTAVALLQGGCELSSVNAEGRSAYQYCAAVPGLISQWWLQCAEPIVVSGATGPCAGEVNGVFDPVSIGAASLPLGRSGLNFGDDAAAQFQYAKRLPTGVTGVALKQLGRAGSSPISVIKLKLTSEGIVIKRSGFNKKKSKIFAKLNYRGGLPETNSRKRWEVSRDSGFLWTKFDKQGGVRVTSRGQLLRLLTDDSLEEAALLRELAGMRMRLGGLAGLLALPARLAAWDDAAVLGYLRRGVDVSRLQVVLVGPARSGKTSLIRKLAGAEGAPVPAPAAPAAVGATTEWSYGDTTYSLMDLGEPKTFANTHAFFFGSDSLFLLVWNPLERDADDLHGYVQSIRDCAPAAPIAVVSTHADRHVPPLDARTLRALDEAFGNVCLYAHVGLPTNEGVSALREEIARVAAEQPHVRHKVPEKFLLLREELRRMGAEDGRFSVQRAEFDEIAARVGLPAVSAPRALDLLLAWGAVYMLPPDGGTLVLQPARLADVVSCLTSPSAPCPVAAAAARRGEKPLETDAASGVLHHTQAALEGVWGRYDPALYPHFLELARQQDLLFPLHDCDGRPLRGLGVSIVPEMLSGGSGGADAFEQAMRGSLFPEDAPELSAVRIRCNLIPAAFFSKLQCRCGFATLIGSSWKYGFAIELRGRRKNGAGEGRGAAFAPSFALVTLQRRHQTLTLYAYGGGAARSAALQAMAALRDACFPFLRFEEVSVIGNSNNSSISNSGSGSLDAGLSAYELGLLRVGPAPPPAPAVEASAAPLEADYDALFARGRGESYAASTVSMLSTAASLVALDTQTQSDAGDDHGMLDIVADNAMTLGGEEIFVSNDMLELFRVAELLGEGEGALENAVNLDIQLSNCVRETMGYCVSRRGASNAAAANRVLWVAYRSGGAGGGVTVCPLSPGPRVGLAWELCRDCALPLPASAGAGAGAGAGDPEQSQSGVLRELSACLRRVLLHLLDADAARILARDAWVGLLDLSAVREKVAAAEQTAFERVSRPPLRTPVYLSAGGAEKMRRLPHYASLRLLELAMDGGDTMAEGAGAGAGAQFYGEVMDNEAMFKLLYEFVHRDMFKITADPEAEAEFEVEPEAEAAPVAAGAGGGPRPLLTGSSAGELTSFDVAEQQSLTASGALLRRMEAGYERVRVAYARDMQHRAFPTTCVLIDSALIKPSMLSLSSTKSYARQAAVRR